MKLLSANFLPIDHVSVSPTDEIGPTQGKSDSELSRVHKRARTSYAIGEKCWCEYNNKSVE